MIAPCPDKRPIASNPVFTGILLTLRFYRHFAIKALNKL